MRLAIVGSTGPWEQFNGDLALTYIEYAFELFKPELFISGGAPGIDTWAEEVADDVAVKKKIYTPTNHQWEPNGYKERNIIIATECDWLICIRSKQSKSYGSGWTADYAAKLGREVRKYEL